MARRTIAGARDVLGQYPRCARGADRTLAPPRRECSLEQRNASQEAGRVLLGVRRRRVVADYELVEPFTQDEARTVCSQVEEMIVGLGQA